MPRRIYSGDLLAKAVVILQSAEGNVPSRNYEGVQAKVAIAREYIRIAKETTSAGILIDGPL